LSIPSVHTGTEDTSHDGFSDDETQYNENGELIDAEEDELYDPNAKSLINYGAILFGEPALDPTEPDYSPEMVKLCTNLVNFALFCGYTNLHCSESPHDSSLEYSLRLDDVRGEHLESVKDDAFLSSAFFLTCTKERLDAIRNNTIQEYEANIGVLPIGPLDSEVVVMHTEKGDKVERPQVRYDIVIGFELCFDGLFFCVFPSVLGYLCCGDLSIFQVLFYDIECYLLFGRLLPHSVFMYTNSLISIIASFSTHRTSPILMAQRMRMHTATPSTCSGSTAS